MPNGDGSSAPPMSESLGMPQPPPVGGAGLAASQSAAQVASQDQTAQQPQPPQVPAPEPPQHHNALAGVLAAIAGPDITHTVDPQTGKITTTATPSSPGNAFRKILAGALTGMGAGAAAGAEGRPGAGILGGIGAGGTAVMAQQRAQNQQDIQNKQQQFENQQKSKLQEATIALHNAELLNQRRNIEIKDAEDFEKVQKSNEVFMGKVTEKGGELFPIVVGGEDINGKPGNMSQMRAYFTNPDNLKPPAGYHFVYNTSYDMSGLHRQGNQWVDKNGDPIDLNSRASEMVALQPDAKLNETHKVSRKEFEAIAGFPPPASMGDSIDMSTADIIGMHTKNVQGQNQHDRIIMAGSGRGDARSDRSYQFSSTQLEKIGAPIDQKMQRFGTMFDSLNANSPAIDPLIAPELLSVAVGGPGSNLRMSEAEIARIVGGKDKWQELKSRLLAWQADPSKPFQVLPEQRGQIRSFLTAIRDRNQKMADAVQSAREQLVDAESPTEHRQILTDVHKKLNDISGGQAGGQAAGGAAPPASLHINPQTKEQIYWDGKAWVPWTGQQTTPP